MNGKKLTVAERAARNPFRVYTYDRLFKREIFCGNATLQGAIDAAIRAVGPHHDRRMKEARSDGTVKAAVIDQHGVKLFEITR